MADYPLLHELEKSDKKFRDQKTAANVKQAIEIYKKNCRYVAENIKKLNFPSFELCCVMQNSHEHLTFIAGKSYMLKNLSIDN